MSTSVLREIVIALALLQASTVVASCARPPGVATPAGPQPLDPSTDHDTYAVYATLLRPRAGDRQAPGPIVLQRETERPDQCSGFLAELTGEWADVAASFQRANSQVRLLQPGAVMGAEYPLISRADILASDARVEAEHPVHTNGLRPGALEYVAFSAVGFNAAKTKALVYMRSRQAPGPAYGIMKMEWKDGRWMTGSRSCGGVA